MKSSRSIRAIPAALASAALLAMSVAAIASQAEEQQNVRIEARTAGTTHSQTGIDETTAFMSQRVGYGDLDLATPAGARELTARIQSAAESVCSKLERLYGSGVFAEDVLEQSTCVRGAMNGAMTQAKLAISSAKMGKAP